MCDRFRVLSKLTSFSSSINEIKREISELEWDYDGEAYVLRTEHLLQTLDRYISGEIDEDILEEWANLIECREDIEYESNNEAAIEEIIDLLSNPELHGPIDLELCHKLISDLKILLSSS